MSDRTFKRYPAKYEEDGLDGLIDKRLHQLSHRRAPVDEVITLTSLYRHYYHSWNIKHFYSFYKHKHGGKRSYTWVKKTLQNEGLVSKSPKQGAHRKKRDRTVIKCPIISSRSCMGAWRFFTKKYFSRK